MNFMDTPLIFQDELARLIEMYPEGEVSSRGGGCWYFSPARVSAFNVEGEADELILSVYLSGITDEDLQNLLRLHEEFAFTSVYAEFDTVQASDMYDCETCGLYSDELLFRFDPSDRSMSVSLIDTHFGGGETVNEVYTDNPVQTFRECCETVFASIDDKWKDLLRPVIEENVATMEKLVSLGLLNKWAAIEKGECDEEVR